jgi:type II secretory pathway pseudopilin PulG
MTGVVITVAATCRRSRFSHRPAKGFTLVELLLAAGLGTVLCGALLQLLLGDLRLTGAMAQRLQARRQQQRALALIREEAELGYGVVADPQPSVDWPCGLAGRRPVLAIALSRQDPDARQHAIVYSVGAAPSPIWRGQVLMRCGPAYGLDGRMDPTGNAQNRVLLDALPPDDGGGLEVIAHPQLSVLELQLTQQLPRSARASGGAAGAGPGAVLLRSRAAL